MLEFIVRLVPGDSMPLKTTPKAFITNAFPMNNHPKTDAAYFGFSELYVRKASKLPFSLTENRIDTILNIYDRIINVTGPIFDNNGIWHFPLLPSTCVGRGGTVVGIDTVWFPNHPNYLYRVDTLCCGENLPLSIDCRDSFITYQATIPFDSIQQYLWQNKSDLKRHQPGQWNRRIMEIAFSEDEQTNYTYLATLGDNTPNGQRRSDFYFNDADGMGCDTCFVLKTNSLPFDLASSTSDPNPVTGIAVDPLNGNRVWASFSGFSKTIKVYYSDDAGDSWTSYDDSHGSLAALNVPVNHIVYQRGTKDRLYIATDVGVYVREDAANGGRWYRYGEEFPNVRTVELKINYCTGKLRVATFGRGTWEIDLLPVEEAVEYRSFRTIDTDQTWTKDKHMSRDIRVKSGITLTLDSMTLNMPKGGLIIIERGAQLIVKHSTITNLCGQTWQGIEIEGTPSKAQMPFNKIDQGRIVLRASTIEYAKNAILNCTNLDFSNTSGGIITARESTFKNNWRSIAFMQYYLGKNETSSFHNCTFTVDDAYRPFDLDTLPGFLGHVSMWNVAGVPIRACTFKDERSNKVGDPVTGGSYGIYALGATPKITSLPVSGNTYPSTNYQRNRFEGLERAIEIGGYPIASTSMIDQCDFVDNEQAVKIDGQNMVQITRNDFQIGGFDSQGNTSNTLVEEYGLGLVGAWGFAVEQNTFKSTSADYMVGSWIEDIGGQPNSLRNNSYDSLLVANLAHGNNEGPLDFDGAQYFCNKNKNNLADFVVYPNPNSNNAATKIALNQGKISEACRNTFSPTADWEFYNAGTQASINYYFAPQASEVPDVNKLYQVQDLQGQTQEENCAENFRNPTYGTVVTVAGGSPLGLPELKTNYNTLKGESEREAYFWLNQVLGYYANDSTGLQIDSIETWILKKTGLYARYELVEHYWQQKRYQDAINYLDAILIEFPIEGRALENHNHYKSLKTLLWNAYKKGRTEAALKQAEVTVLREMAVEKVGFSSVQAASIVRFFYGNAPAFYPALPNWNATEERKEQEQIGVLSPTIWGYPNPTVDWIDVVYELPNEVTTGILEVNAVSGQIIQTIKINQNNGSITLNTSTWSPGIYFATLSIEGMQSNVYKIVIRK